MKSIKMNILTMSTCLLALFTVIGCGNSTRDDTEASGTETENVVSESEPQKVPSKEFSFDGSSSEKGAIANIGGNSYTIELMLKDNDHSTKFSYSKTSPPMPFKIGGWVLSKQGQGKYSIYNADGNISTNLKYNDGWNKIRIVADAEKIETAFYLNDNIVSRKPSFANIKTTYTLGKGHEQRYWKGEVKEIYVTDLVGNKSIIQF